MTVRVGDPEYMAFMQECRDMGEDGANFQIALALTKVQERDRTIRRLQNDIVNIKAVEARVITNRTETIVELQRELAKRDATIARLRASVATMRYVLEMELSYHNDVCHVYWEKYGDPTGKQRLDLIREALAEQPS